VRRTAAYTGVYKHCASTSSVSCCIHVRKHALRRGRENNIKMDLNEIGYEDVDCILRAQDMDEYNAVLE
jgi:hypothetical protein